MVRVSFFIVMSTVLLCGCAAEQQGRHSLAKDLIDCVPKPTVADLWACASKKAGFRDSSRSRRQGRGKDGVLIAGFETQHPPLFS